MPTNSPELTPELAAKLVFYSYELPQGNVDNHARLFDIVHAKHPRWRVGSELRSQIVPLGLGMLYKFLDEDRGPKLHEPVSVRRLHKSLSTTLDEMQESLSGRTSASLEDLYKDFLAVTVGTDHRFLVRPSGRPASAKDPWESYFRTHILEKPTTEFGVYREILLDLQGVWSDRSNRAEILRRDSPYQDTQEKASCRDNCATVADKLKHVVNIWQVHHDQKYTNNPNLITS